MTLENKRAALDHVRDDWVARTVRNLRRNPHGLEGLPVIQWIVLLVVALDTGEASLDPLELDHWTGAAISSLARLACQQGAPRGRAREDARWALSQIGLTPETADESLANEESRHDLMLSVWEERLRRLLAAGYVDA